MITDYFSDNDDNDHVLFHLHLHLLISVSSVHTYIIATSAQEDCTIAVANPEEGDYPEPNKGRWCIFC